MHLYNLYQDVFSLHLKSFRELSYSPTNQTKYKNHLIFLVSSIHWFRTWLNHKFGFYNGTAILECKHESNDFESLSTYRSKSQIIFRGVNFSLHFYYGLRLNIPTCSTHSILEALFEKYTKHCILFNSINNIM